MAKDRVEKKEKKEKKDKKRSESDGVKKSKKEKKDKKVLSESAQNELTDKLLADLEKPAADAVVEAAADGDEMVVDVAEETTAVVKTDRPVGAVVPFANPLVEDKTAKKVLKSVKKGKFTTPSLFFLLSFFFFFFLPRNICANALSYSCCKQVS